MTILYVDLASGNDSTGNGTAALPYKTISKGTTGLTGGDECRVGSNTAPTALTGTIAFTNGSVAAATSADLTAELAVGDIVGVNAAGEGWWVVASIISTVVSLVHQYWSGDTDYDNDAVTAYKLNPIASTTYETINASGVSVASRLKVSGGWNLATETQDGITSIARANSYFIRMNTKNYVELSNFLFVTNASSQYTYNAGVGNLFKDIYYVRGTTDQAFIPDNNCEYENLYINPGAQDGLYISSKYNIGIKTAKIYSSGDNAIIIDGTSGNISISDPSCYNSADTPLSIDTYGSNIFIKDLYIKKVRDASTHGVYIVKGRNIILDTPDINETIGYGIYLYGNGQPTIISPKFTSIGLTTPIFIYATSQDLAPRLFLSAYEEVFGDATPREIMQFVYGKAYKAETGSRSGSMIDLQCSNASYYNTVPVGAYVVTAVSPDLTLSIYLKKSVTSNQTYTEIFARCGGYVSSKNIVTSDLTTDWVNFSVVIPAAELSVGKLVELYVTTIASVGSLYIDDFGVSQ